MNTTQTQSTARFEARIYRAAVTRTNPVWNSETRTEEMVTKDFPAEWAVYQVATGVRMAYAKNEESARATAEKWNAGNMPELIANKAESAETLHKLLKPGDTVKTILRNVSRSGMARRISCIIARDNEIIDITWDVARISGESTKQGGQYVQDAGLLAKGCGMDMGFSVVYNLGRELFPDGFGATVGIAPVGKRMSTDVGRGITASLRPIDKERIAELVARGWKFNGRNGDASGWDTDGGYALNQRWL